MKAFGGTSDRWPTCPTGTITCDDRPEQALLISINNRYRTEASSFDSFAIHHPIPHTEYQYHPLVPSVRLNHCHSTLPHLNNINDYAAYFSFSPTNSVASSLSSTVHVCIRIRVPVTVCGGSCSVNPSFVLLLPFCFVVHHYKHHMYYTYCLFFFFDYASTLHHCIIINIDSYRHSQTSILLSRSRSRSDSSYCFHGHDHVSLVQESM